MNGDARPLPSILYTVPAWSCVTRSDPSCANASLYGLVTARVTVVIVPVAAAIRSR